MKQLIFIFTLISLGFNAQIKIPSETVEIKIASISPNIVKSIRLNEKTDEFENYGRETQSTIVFKDSIDIARIKNVKVLSTPDQKALISILNKKFEWQGEEEQTVIECYYPRHFISFLNKDGVLIAGLEICIQCQGNRTFLIEDRSSVYLAPQHYKYLQELFEKYNLLKN